MNPADGIIFDETVKKPNESLTAERVYYLHETNKQKPLFSCKYLTGREFEIQRESEHNKIIK